MKISGLICLSAMALCLQRAGSLQCYWCLTPTPGDLCRTIKNCSEEQAWCFTTVIGPTSSGYPFKGSRTVIRDCAETCKQSNPNNLGTTTPTYCCQNDTCNVMSRAQAVTTGDWPLAAILLAVIIALKRQMSA
ncbi:secreted Ly-6/uPAR-related protein 1-like [Rana temporaria]|uniref:secreted Ly-6/uPAR-related protein 1-like n=1 Tax=Rana temporaria TaxID=8407 RepID=UPI001AACAA3C|nr:secreted Ly-6/uPAR-related protein 1-like [Rana temporaria]